MVLPGDPVPVADLEPLGLGEADAPPVSANYMDEVTVGLLQFDTIRKIVYKLNGNRR